MTQTPKKAASLRTWVRDRVMFLALIIFVIGAAGYIASGKFFPPDSIWLHPAKEFSLLLSLIGMVSLGYELFLRELTFNEYKEALQEIVNPDAVRLGIQGIYKNRSELGSTFTFDNLFKKVQKEIFIGGSSLLSISTSSRDLLKTKVKQGINVKLLLMDPMSPVVDLITRQGGGKPTFRNEIRTSLMLLQKVAHEIEAESEGGKQGKFLVHTYNTIPSHSFISVDAGNSSGFIIADIGPYLGRATPRPSMLVVNKKNGMYDYWMEMCDNMWDGSKPVNLEDADLFDAKTKTLVVTSGKGTEYYDASSESWHPATICQMADSWRTIKGSHWIWVRESVTLEEAKTGSQHRFRVKFDLPPGKQEAIVRADLLLRSDDVCHITVNDVGVKQEYGGADYPDPFLIDISKYVRSGENNLYFELICFARPEAETPEDNQTGLIFRLQVEYRE